MTGIHHVTAISGKAARNLDFYTHVLGLRFVKKTVNFDDPGTLSPVLRGLRRSSRYHPHILCLGGRRTRPRWRGAYARNGVPRPG